MKKIIYGFLVCIISQFNILVFGAEIIAQGPPPRITQETFETYSAKEYWQSRLPYNDAIVALQKRDFRLFFIPHGLGPGEMPGIICITRPDRQYFFGRGIISDARTGKEQVLYEEALRKYATTYNFIISSSPDFPLSDYCKSKPAPFLEKLGGTFEFRTPTGPSTLSLIGAIRRRDQKTIKKFKLESKPGYPRTLGLTTASWAALTGDEEIFNLIYDPEKHAPSTASKKLNLMNNLTVDFAAIGGNISITDRLIKNGHVAQMLPNKYGYPSLGSFIKPEVFDLLRNSFNYNQEIVSEFSNAAIRDRNDELAWHILKQQLIPNKTFFIQTNKHGATSLLTRYLTDVGLEQFEKDFPAAIDRITQNSILKFLYQKNIRGETISDLLDRPMPKDPYGLYQSFYRKSAIELSSFKAIYEQYGLAPHLAVLAALEDNDVQFLHQLIAKRHLRDELTAKYKADLFLLIIANEISMPLPLFLEFDITFKNALNESPCELISNRFDYLDDEQKQAIIRFLIKAPEHLSKCSKNNYRLNIRPLMQAATDDQLSKLIDAINRSKKLSKQEREEILFENMISVLSFKSGDFTHAFIKTAYKADPTQETLKWLENIVSIGPDTGAMRLLFDLGLSATETDDPRHIGIFKAAYGGNLEQVKTYIDYGEDKYRVSPNEGPLPLFACLKIGEPAQSLYEPYNHNCITGLNLRMLQEFIIQKDEKAVQTLLKKMNGKWEGLRGWHQTILKALISQNMRAAAITLSKGLPTPDSWRMEREISDDHPHGGLHDFSFWNDSNFYNKLPYQDLPTIVFKTQNLSLISAVLDYYSKIVRLRRYESLSAASVYVTPKTYQIFQQAMKHHKVTTKYQEFSEEMRPYVTKKHLETGNDAKLVTKIKVYLTEHNIEAANQLLDSIKKHGIELKQRHKITLASMAENIGQFQLAKELLKD